MPKKTKNKKQKLTVLSDVTVRDRRTGELRDVNPKLAEQLLATGTYTVASRGEKAVEASKPLFQSERSTASKFQAFGLGGLDALSLGTSGPLLAELDPETALVSEANPTQFGAGFGVGLLTGVGGGLIAKTPGALGAIARATPQALLTRGATSVGARIAARGAGIAGQVAGLAVEGAIENGGFEAGRLISQAALGNEDLTTETIAGNILGGIALGGAAGALTAGVTGVLGRRIKSLEADQASIKLSQEARESFEHTARSLDDFSDGVLRQVEAEAKAAGKVRLDKLPTEKDILAQVNDIPAFRGFNFKNLDAVKAHAFRSGDAELAQFVDEALENLASKTANRAAVEGAIAEASQIPEAVTKFRAAQQAFQKAAGKNFSKAFAKLETPEAAVDFAKKFADYTDSGRKAAMAIGNKEVADGFTFHVDKIKSLVDSEVMRRLGSAGEQMLTKGEVVEGVLAAAGLSTDAFEIGGDAEPLLQLWAFTKAGKLAKAAPGRMRSLLHTGIDRATRSAIFGATFRRTGSFPLAEAARSSVGAHIGKHIGDLVTIQKQAEDRIAKSLSRLRGVRKSIRPVTRVSTLASLAAFNLYDERGRPKTEQDAFNRIQEQLAKGPQAAAVRAIDATAILQGVNPAMGSKVSQQLELNLGYIMDRIPRDPGTLAKFGKTVWRPTPQELHDFGKLVRAVMDPASVLEDFANGTLHPIAARALKDLYPEHFLHIQQWVTENVETVREWPFSRQIQTGYLFDTNAPHPLLPQINSHQTRFAEARALDEQRGQKQSQPGTASQGDLQSQLTPAQQLLNR